MVDQDPFYIQGLLAQAGSSKALDDKIGYFGISPTGNLSFSMPNGADGAAAFKTGDKKREAAARQFLSYWMGDGYKDYIDSKSLVSIEPSVPTPSSIPELSKTVLKALNNSVPGMQAVALANPDNYIYISNMIQGTMTAKQVGAAMQNQFDQLAKALGVKGF